MSKEDVLKIVREILSKDENFNGAKVEVIFNDKKENTKDKKRWTTIAEYDLMSIQG